MTSRLVETGRVLGAFGVRGWLKIDPSGWKDVLLAARPWWFRSVQGGEPRLLRVEGVRDRGKILIAKWEGCGAPEEAPLWRGRILVARSDFPDAPEGTWWACDLAGCSVEDAGGKLLGTVASVESNGAQNLLAVRRDDGSSFLIPIAGSYIVSVDVGEKKIVADWGEDWL